MTTTTRVVSLRPVTAEDREFLVGLYATTRAAELDQVEWGPGQRDWFVRMQFEAQDTSYRAQNPHGSFDVIEVGGEPAGRLYADRRDDEIRIVDIALLPRFCGAGIGAHLIGLLQDEAAASARMLSIHVEIHNPAQRLYGRLGFVVAGEQGLYRRMEWTA